MALTPVESGDLEYFVYALEDWYRVFCLLRYYWRGRSRVEQEGDGVSKKQNKTVESSTFFFDRQLAVFRRNPREALHMGDDDDSEGSEHGYEDDPDYEADVARLLALGLYIDNLSADDLETWMFEHPMPSAADLDDGIEKGRAGATHDLRRDPRPTHAERLYEIISALSE